MLDSAKKFLTKNATFFRLTTEDLVNLEYEFVLSNPSVIELYAYLKKPYKKTYYGKAIDLYLPIGKPVQQEVAISFVFLGNGVLVSFHNRNDTMGDLSNLNLYETLPVLSDIILKDIQTRKIKYSCCGPVESGPFSTEEITLISEDIRLFVVNGRLETHLVFVYRIGEGSNTLHRFYYDAHTGEFLGFENDFIC